MTVGESRFRGTLKRLAVGVAIAPAALTVFGPAAGQQIADKTCSYNTWEWDTRAKRSVNHRRVVKPYAAVTREERDPSSACTVCEQDQTTVRLDGLSAILVCRHYAAAVKDALLGIRAAGFPIVTVVAYRVGRTRGKPDGNGLRTGFSNHSFGTAIDINSGRNGLYANCVTFGPACRLIRGGTWTPSRPGTIVAGSVAVKAFKAIGFKWGGEIAGRQKDFMHFSLTGY